MLPVTQLLTAEEAEEVLSPHREAIRGSIHKGWQQWRDLVKDHPQLDMIVSSRTRAGLVYDFIRHEALGAFFAEPSVHVSEDRSFLLLTFDQKLILRFKKFRNDKMLTASARTKQAQEYALQVLPGMEALTHLVAGYLPDELGINLEKTAITCVLGPDLKWWIDLDLDLESGVGGSVTPDMPQLPTQQQAGTIVRPRRSGDPETAPGQSSKES